MISVDVSKKLKAGHLPLSLRVKLQVQKGSVTCIQGPSGTGKTSLLKIIAGLMQPDAGCIKVDGHTWLDTGAGISLSPQQRMAGFVFQNYALFPNMTAEQQLTYATKDHAWISHLLHIGKLTHLKTHRPEYLSGGQQQRLAILRAMAIKPRLLLMDEPFSALDKSTKAELAGHLGQLWQETGTTVFIVTHNPDELKELTTTILNIGADSAII